MAFWNIYAWVVDGPIYWVRLHCFAFIIAVLVAILLPKLTLRAGGAVERWLARIGRRRALAISIAFLLPIGIRVALLPLLPKPRPAIHDEFGYLLAADTFASGRVTNPTPPLWPHFETFHVNLVPTYQSMYPPAQGLVLAAGKRLSGEPWTAVLVSVGLMCAAIYWALRGWMPPGWALLGGLLAGLHYGGTYYWINSYWGGAVAALGGALVLGALPRIMRIQRRRDSILFAVGVVVLANSRPYEGMLLTIPVGIALAAWLLRRPLRQGVALTQVVLPAALVLATSAAAMLYYNWRSTGSPLLMPYQVNQRQYHITGPFLWQDLRPPPTYTHAEMRAFYWSWEYKEWAATRRAIGLRVLTEKKLYTYYWHYVWPCLPALLVGCWCLGRNPRFRVLPAALTFLLLGLMLEVWLANPHYAAPATALVLTIGLFGLRYLRLWRRRSGLGLRWSRAAVLVVLVLSVGQLRDVFGAGTNPTRAWQYTLEDVTAFPEGCYVARMRLQKQLEHLPGDHLVMVRYSTSHNPFCEWVYNAADIENSRIVWAREMSPGQNQQLLSHFSWRRAWLVEPDYRFPRLRPYISSATDLVNEGDSSGGSGMPMTARNSKAYARPR